MSVMIWGGLSDTHKVIEMSMMSGRGSAGVEQVPAGMAWRGSGGAHKAIEMSAASGRGPIEVEQGLARTFVATQEGSIGAGQEPLWVEPTTLGEL